MVAVSLRDPWQGVDRRNNQRTPFNQTSAKVNKVRDPVRDPLSTHRARALCGRHHLRFDLSLSTPGSQRSSSSSCCSSTKHKMSKGGATSQGSNLAYIAVAATVGGVVAAVTTLALVRLLGTAATSRKREAEKTLVAVSANTRYIISTSGRPQSIRRYNVLLQDILGEDVAYLPMSSTSADGKIRADAFASDDFRCREGQQKQDIRGQSFDRKVIFGHLRGTSCGTPGGQN